MKKFNAFQLKLFFMVLMVFDHLHHIPGFLPPWWQEIFHVLTRCVGPFFAFMAVEGFLHTRNRFKYNARLFMWAGIMFAGNFGLNLLFQQESLVVYNNIFYTLAVGVLALNAWAFPVEKLKINRTFAKVIKVFLALLISIYACVAYEGSMSMIPFMLICYFLRDKVKLRNIVTILLCVFLFIINFDILPTMEQTIRLMMFNSDWLLFTVLPFLSFYNGERGPSNRFSKYLFYVFYPAHLWIIALIGYFVMK